MPVNAAHTALATKAPVTTLPTRTPAMAAVARLLPTAYRRRPKTVYRWITKPAMAMPISSRMGVGTPRTLPSMRLPRNSGVVPGTVPFVYPSAMPATISCEPRVMMNDGTFNTVTPIPFSRPISAAIARISTNSTMAGSVPSHAVVSTPVSEMTEAMDRSSSPTRMTRPCPKPTRVSIEEMTRMAETVFQEPSDGLTKRDSGISRAVTAKSSRM